jgi:hypothetical protein
MRKDGHTLMTTSQHGCVNGLFVLDTSTLGLMGLQQWSGQRGLAPGASGHWLRQC